MRFSLRTMLEAIFVVGVVLTIWRMYHTPSIMRGETLAISVTGTYPDQPVNGIYIVDENGSVSLGPEYGTVSVAGLLPEEAREAITTQLRTIGLAYPQASVSRTGEDTLILLQATNRQLETEIDRLKERLANREATAKK